MNFVIMEQVRKCTLQLFLITGLFSFSAWSKNLTVPVFYWSSKIEAQVSMRAGLEEEIAKYNKTSEDKINLVPNVAGENRQGVLNQIHQLEEAFKTKPDALIIQPTDISTVSKALQEANQRGIPVFTFDQFILNGNIASYVASDNYQAGWDNGIYIEGLFPKNQEIKIVVFEYTKVSAVINRIDGFFDALRSKRRKFTVLKRYDAVDPGAATIKVDEFLKDFPKKKSVDAIFTVNDGGGITIVKKLWEKGRKEIVHATIDGDPVALENIKAKRLTVIDSAQFCAEMGREIGRQVIAYFQNKAVIAKKLIPTFPVTESTLTQFRGWMGAPVAPPKSFLDTRTPNNGNGNKSYAGITIKIGIAPHCPYLCEQGRNQWGGYVYDILKDLATKNNFKLEIVSLPNSELTKALNNHQIQFAVLPSYFVRYLDDYTIANTKLGVSYTGALFTPGVRIRVVDRDSLNNLRIAFASLGQESDLNLNPAEFKKSLKIEGADVADRMIKIIGERRIDVALGDYNVIRYTLLRRQQLNLELQATSLTGFNTLSLVSLPQDSEFGDLPHRLQLWFTEARGAGKLDKILKKYNLSDWKDFEY